MTDTYQNIIEHYSNFPTEVQILKSLLENQVAKDLSFHPMVTYIGSSQEKSIVLFAPRAGTHQENSYYVSEMLQLYPTINPYAAIIVMIGKLEHEDKLFPILNIFFVNEHVAFIAAFPYEIDNNKVIWHDSLNIVAGLEEAAYEADAKDFIGMIYLYTHLAASPFVSSDVLSYLSYNNYGIQTHENHYNYFHLTPS